MKPDDPTKTSPPNPPKPGTSWAVGNLENIGKLTAEQFQRICDKTMARERASNPGKVVQIWPADDD